MKKVQKFLSIFAIVIIILSSVIIIKNIENYNYAKECLEETITFSKMALEENQYGEAQQETKNSKYYDRIVGSIKSETEFLNGIFEEDGLKAVIYNYIGKLYQSQFEIAASSIDYNMARVLLMSVFITIIIFFALEAKSSNARKYILINLLMILIIFVFSVLIDLLTNTFDLYEHWYEMFLENQDTILPLIVIYLLALVTNLKINMNKSFRVNIIYIVFSVLVGLILEYVINIENVIIPIYLLLASVDDIYNYIKMRR